MNRFTVAKTTTISGVGLHTGRKVSMTVRPVDGGTGRIWRRTDLAGADIPALVPYVSQTAHRTELSCGDVSVSTVEHFLATAYAFGIDDMHIELTGPEVPMGDGSANPCLDMLRRAGCAETNGIVHPFVVSSSFEVRYAQSLYVVEPAPQLSLSVRIDVPHPLIGEQSIDVDIDKHTFASEIASARTFGYFDDHERLQKLGLARGADSTNVLVLTQDGLLDGTLRWPDEFVRHKALDLVGDLALVGWPIWAHITATQPGHAGNVALARALYALVTQQVEA